MDFPDRCFKGILKKEWVRPTGGVSVQIFEFKPNQTDPTFIETSIYWEEDDNTIEFARKQKKGGTDSPAHEGGLAEILTEDLKSMKKLPIFTGLFEYKKTHIVTNPYHGDLVLGPNIEKEIRNRARFHLANLVKHVF